MSADIRILGPGDAGLLTGPGAEIAPDVFDDAIRPDRLERLLHDPSHVMAVAVRDGRIVGQVRAMLHHQPDGPPELYVDNLGVTPAERRKGLASRLMAETARWGRDRGAETCWLAARPENSVARALYRRLGFRTDNVVMIEAPTGAPGLTPTDWRRL